MSDVKRDCQLVVMGPFGRVYLSHVVGFESQLANQPPGTWEGTFALERGGNAADDFIARVEAACSGGGTVSAGTLYQYVAEPDGSTSTYQYDGAIFRLRNVGALQRVEFHAQRRRRI